MKLGNSIPLISYRKKFFVRSVATIAAAVGIILLIYEYIGILRVRNAPDLIWSLIIDYTYLYRKLRVAIALILNLVAIWPLKMRRCLISVLALLWCLIEYGIWYFLSQKLKESAGINRLPEPSAMGFLGATWWDILLLVLIVVLLAWTIKLLMAFLMPSRHEPDNEGLDNEEAVQHS